MKRYLIALLLLLPFVTFAQDGFLEDYQVDQIEIIRDQYGVPHIYAPTDYQCAYGLIWATLEDQYQLICQQLLTGRGLRATWSGKAGAKTDYYGQWIQARERVDQDFDRLSPDYKKILFAASAAANDYAAKHKPPLRAARKLFPAHPKDFLTNMVITLSGMVGLPQALQMAMKGKADEYVFPPRFGSNEWAFNSSKTTSGKPTLVINPHVEFYGEHSFYEASVHSQEGWDFWGALFPGMPTPALGCSRDIGYAITFNWPDYVDIYKLEINPDNKNQYKFDGQWRDFERDKAKMKVKLAFLKLPIKKETIWSVHGPAFRTDHGVYAFRYAEKDPVLAGEQWYRMSKSKTLDDFKTAMAMQAIPLFNLAYTDRYDNIYYVSSGNIPERADGYDWQSTLPGDDPKTLWTAYMPYERMPQLENPDCGYLYNTNNTPFHTTCDDAVIDSTLYDRKYGIHWNKANNRDMRVREIMAQYEGEKMSMAEIKAMKFDHQWAKGGSMHTITLKNFDMLDPQAHPELADAITICQNWDGNGDSMNTNATMPMLVMKLLGDKMHISYGSLEDGYVADRNMLLETIEEAQDHLMKRFGTIEVPLGRVQRHCRGDNCLPLAGLPEALRAVYPVGAEPGTLVCSVGDTFTAFAEFGKNGLERMETIVPYGASADPDSPHYTDQMEMYVQEKTKRVILEKSELIKQAERVYAPK